MAHSRIVKRYSVALFRNAEQSGVTDAVLADLLYVRRIIGESKDLRVMLSSPVIRKAVKTDVLREVFASNVSPLTMDFLAFLNNKGREAYIQEAISMFEEVYNEARAILKVVVESATALTDDVRENVISSMASLTGKRINPTFKVNKSLIGGLKIQVHDMCYDGSILSQLSALYSQLAGSEMTIEVRAKIAAV
ncbi:MAG TPA: ATP synthase F1 subunit delta [Candidatus Kapabacteria bacterium]|nr:ATP synthase F1 subunit delta [Candidatus Kapabacteria bacterium]